MTIRSSSEVQSTWDLCVSGIFEPALKTVVGVGFLGFELTEAIVRFAVEFCEPPKTETTRKVTGVFRELVLSRESPLLASAGIERKPSPYDVKSLLSSSRSSSVGLELDQEDVKSTADVGENPQDEIISDPESDDSWEILSNS